MYFTPPMRVFPLEFVISMGLNQLEWHPTRSLKKLDDMSIRLNTIPAVDRRTDGQSDGFAHNSNAFCMHCMETRDKTEKKTAELKKLQICSERWTNVYEQNVILHFVDYLLFQFINNLICLYSIHIDAEDRWETSVPIVSTIQSHTPGIDPQCW